MSAPSNRSGDLPARIAPPSWPLNLRKHRVKNSWGEWAFANSEDLARLNAQAATHPTPNDQLTDIKPPAAPKKQPRDPFSVDARRVTFKNIPIRQQTIDEERTTFREIPDPQPRTPEAQSAKMQIANGTEEGPMEYTYAPRFDANGPDSRAPIVTPDGTWYFVPTTQGGAMPQVATPPNPTKPTNPRFNLTPYIEHAAPPPQRPPVWMPQPTFPGPQPSLERGGPGWPEPRPMYPHQHHPQWSAPMHQHPAVGPPFGMGLTANEVRARNLVIAENNKVNEAQSIAPADPNPERMYWVREFDGTWTLRNRLTIESGDIGDWTWYIDPSNNTFYAVLKKGKAKEE